MFFNLHEEHKIGFKKLSQADLGANETSHQTHIGLYENILDFLPNKGDCVQTAMLIYDEYCDIVSCRFNRILTPQGTYRSPKIKSGFDEDDSLVKKIREFASNAPDKDWYLVWFGLQSEELVFWLLDETSEDYRNISRVFHQVNKVYDIKDEKGLLNLIEQRINNVSIELQKDLEIVSQVGGSKRQYKPFDMDAAAKTFRDTGIKGEAMVAEYLEKQVHLKHIKSYEWMNKNHETGLPYDFYIDERIFMDVKATQYDFEQQIIFSTQELKFISTKKDWQYAVYRVYDIAKEKAKLKVCSKCIKYVNDLRGRIQTFDQDMSKVQAEVRSLKVAVLPKPMFATIGSELSLSVS